MDIGESVYQTQPCYQKLSSWQTSRLYRPQRHNGLARRILTFCILNVFSIALDIVAFSFFPVSVWAYQLPTSRMELYVGEATVVRQPGLVRIAVGNGDVMTVNVVKEDEVLIMPEKPGDTVVHFWYTNGSERDLTIHVIPENPERVITEVRSILRNEKNVGARLVADKVVLEGSNINKVTRARIDAIKERYPQIVDQVSKVGLEKMIHMDVKFVEFRKSALDRVGIKWQEAILGPTFGAAADATNNNLFRITPKQSDIFGGVDGQLPSRINPFQAYFGIVTSLSSRINLLAQTGDAYTLAEPKLTCKSGGEATFLSGGELPIPFQSTFGGIQVQFRPFGIKLEINPTADDTGIIDTKIFTEVSSVDFSLKVLEVPGLQKKNTRTEVTVREGETIVISGLLNSDVTKAIDKIPTLGDVPILGNLFRSREFQNKQTELVIFVTPRIVTPSSPLNTDVVTREESDLRRARERLKPVFVD